ncbi:MAG: right-handed parallel beta-helix repeat-containing protein [bacterium]|nr:MAG: right-handed parallel beta-helix repeat-containing protein [bacterium]
MRKSFSIMSAVVLFLYLASCETKGPEEQSVVIGPDTVPVSLDTYKNIWYVSATSGSDSDGDGTQDKPWQSLSHALRQITDASVDNRYAILVASAVYSNTPLKMKSYVDLYGGFNATDWQRDVLKNRTVLTGGGERRVIIGADSSRLDGFTVLSGKIRGKGAGLFCSGTSPIISNNVFMNNKTLGPIPWRPKNLHEVANDGGAIYCENGSSPVLENNIFVNNTTEIGRGAAIAFHSKCNGRIANNVFLNNIAGTDDPMRSSDGGAISIFDWSSPVVENNLILNNEALATNDAGGIFVALWSSPRIINNIFVGNRCADDAGGLFVGGQEHRYDMPLDPLPAEDEFFVLIEGNTFIGNSNPSQNSGAMRFTMESRGVFRNNTVAHNTGIYFQKCEVVIEKNVIFDNFLFIEPKTGMKSSMIKDNLILGDFTLEVEAQVSNNILNVDSNDPRFINDWHEIRAAAAQYSRKTNTTNFFVLESNFERIQLVNRIIKIGNRWSVVKSNVQNRVEVWGNFSGEVNITVLPTYQIK